ncbi:MAG: MbnP family protein [Chitinophagales bacterium]
MNKTSILIFLSLFLFSCKKEKTTTVQFVVNSSGKTPNGRNYSIDATKTRILFSNFKLITSTGSEVMVKDVFLYKTTDNSFSFKMPEGNFTGFRFSYGLDSSVNNTNPMSYPASSPLSVETSLYWDMLKYRFSVIEASIDNSPGKNQPPNSPFSMHLGSDTLYTVINSNVIPFNGSIVNIELDMDKLFVLDTDPFQIINFSNHSEPSEIARAVAIKNSFVNGIKTTLWAPD